ncbi:hypothetical protein BDK51DRAFT_49327 [Blyttiomyces helicus]|uniref:Uncharacterized protein n=1 Tax=Blyttiomyces helicus TaxID=388810 RepID=A0A4P9WJ07_9FUNG|nr:hypothetical protein BDK51DRAFT_49327 [Blyttiomyces helicus]|eukprot:RKO92342.1 hypothetical protein BDK51DRAFT_49327 [Blyttiomyces helicus]
MSRSKKLKKLEARINELDEEKINAAVRDFPEVGKDRVLGRRGGTSDEYMRTKLVCGEAKCYLAPTNIWQFIAYCGVIHKARKSAGRQNSTVYGFVTNSAAWQFVRIHSKSKVWTSLVVSEEDATTWLSDLRKNEVDNFKIVVERFRTIEGDESEDESKEEEEDGTDLVRGMDKLNISSEINERLEKAKVEALLNELPEDKIEFDVGDHPDLKASEIRSGKKESLPIRDCTEDDIEKIL